MKLKAVIAESTGWAFRPHGSPVRSDRVRIDIALAGLCRTDVQAMTGQRTVAHGRVLGHEAAGWLSHIPESLKAVAALRGLHLGDRVAFFPFLPCGCCEACLREGVLGHCHAPSALGLDEDGAFAGTVDVPLSVVFPAPPELAWEALAYAEPMAAALAVWDLPEVSSASRLAVVGEGRIAELTVRVVEARRSKTGTSALSENPMGVGSTPAAPPFVWRVLPSGALPTGLMPASLDVVIETHPTAQALALAVSLLKPGGLLVLKSRPSSAVPWPHQDMVMRRIRTVGASYGSFEQGLALMAQGAVRVDDLFGPRYPWTHAGITAALHDEAQNRETSGKLFFDVAGLAALGKGIP